MGGGDNVKIIFVSLLKGIFSKREDFAPKGITSFLLEKTLFQKGFGTQGKQKVTKVVSLVKYGGKSTKYTTVSSPLTSSCYMQMFFGDFPNIKVEAGLWR